MNENIYSVMSLSQDLLKNYSEQINEVEKLENKIGYKFKNKKLLYTAMTHKSFPPMMKIRYGVNLEDSEKLEFLGDSILSFCLSSMIFKRKDCESEKQATSARAAMSSNQNLFQIAKKLELDKAIFKHPLAQNLEKSMADAVEALIGAIYEDSGLGTVKSFIGRLFKEELNQRIDKLIKKNYRQYFNEIFPELKQEFFEIKDEDGRVQHQVNILSPEGVCISSAIGESKKMAATKAIKPIIEKIS